MSEAHRLSAILETSAHKWHDEGKRSWWPPYRWHCFGCASGLLLAAKKAAQVQRDHEQELINSALRANRERARRGTCI